jgi:transposase InsO family protein
MGQVLHGSARTTAAVRRAIQHSQESLRVLARRHGINPKTVAKWKKRTSVQDERTGPKEPRSTVLSTEEEAIIIAFRRHTLLPLDDCLYALQATIPHLTRSSLHRCLQRHGISRLPETEGNKPAKKRFKPYPIGYFHIDIAEVRTEQGKLYLFVAIDRTSKFAFAELHEKATRRIAGDFLRHLIAAVPYRVHTVLTDNGTHFTTPGNTASAAPLIKAAIARGELFRAHAFELACAQNDIDHRLTKPRHPWTNGQVERMNRTIKDATVRRYHYDSHDQLRQHLSDFVTVYNFARRLKTLKGLTPYEFICKRWTLEPERFRLNPLHQMPGLNTYAARRRRGEPISTAFVESAVNAIVAKRMNKAQQMRWSRATVQPFLDVRTAVLNGTLEHAFRQRYPGFRPANDDHKATATAA